ncbi:hypothetical protein PR048_016492 [Dryococelus australis]|uniref:Uncharacterized protein n=1 Tax=Dryococelus australis TaxID=614101 RepID=A0ABQ9HKB3_9NEOP|nr:hypothetical protein PR048_016492 [Dryococelus australis]
MESNLAPSRGDYRTCLHRVLTWTLGGVYLAFPVLEQYAHPVQYNASLPGPASTKPRWSEEELRIMARDEVFLPENIRFVNQALVVRLHGKGLFVERTLDSIKDQRKQPKYQKLVKEIHSFELSDPLSTMTKRWSTGATANLPRRSEGGGVVIPEANILVAAVDAAERGETVVGFTDKWFRKVFPVMDCVKPLPENLDHPFEVTRQEVRRIMYARLQALWRKNSSNLAAKIL